MTLNKENFMNFEGFFAVFKNNEIQDVYQAEKEYVHYIGVDCPTSKTNFLNYLYNQNCEFFDLKNINKI